MKFYLSGGMEYKADLGEEWRSWLTKELAKFGYGVVDPIKLEKTSKEGVSTQAKVTQLKCEGNFPEVRRIVYRLIRKDMKGIQQSDAIVVLYDKYARQGAGTVSEAWEAFREGIPIYLITELPIEEVPSCLIGESTALFTNFDDFLKHVGNHITLSSDTVFAKKVREEVLGEIY